jgi:tRNA 2-thiocytidine biosynthesis protein TtcA
MFTGRLSSLPPVTHSREKDFRLIRPLVYVTEEITRDYVAGKGVPVVPCGCSLRTGTVRRSIRETIADWEIEHPHLRENILSAMGNIQHGRLLDTRYLDAAEPAAESEFSLGGTELLPILHEA